MSKKKISLLIVTPSFKGGGAEKVAVNLANQYSLDGMDVTLLAVNSEGPYRRLLSESVNVIDLDGEGFISSFPAVLKALREINPENVLSVIRETNILVGFSRFFVKMRRVVFREANTLDHIYGSKWYKRVIWYFLMKVSYIKADMVVANSEGTMSDLVKSKLVDKAKVKVIGNPVLPPNVNELLAGGVNDPWFQDPTIKVVLNVGSLHAQKNQAMLIKAFSKVEKKISSARLIILGEGVEKERLVQLSFAEGVSDKVKIIPFQNNPYPYYTGSDLFVLSSDYEGFGNVVVEALSSGNPVISTDCPGGPRSILAAGEFGVLTKVGDSMGLAEQIIDVLTGRIYFEPSKLVERSQDYSVATISEKYWSLFESVKND